MGHAVHADLFKNASKPIVTSVIPNLGIVWSGTQYPRNFGQGHIGRGRIDIARAILGGRGIRRERVIVEIIRRVVMVQGQNTSVRDNLS